MQYVLDGGALLNHIPWPSSPITYGDLCALHTDYVTRTYGKPVVLFDEFK